MSLALGTKLGPYEILSAIGAGGMGEVYRARDTRLGRDVALKVLPASFSRDPDRLRRFEQEARAVAALNHPNIIGIYDIGDGSATQGGAPYIVSELLEGSSLRDVLDKSPLSSRKASDYAAQIAQGLAAAHEKGIVHRDLKPENIFVTKEGRVKILDFGLAKQAPAAADASGATVTSSPTEAGTVMGTAGYMAPEQVRGMAVDSRTDIFAFGSVLYEMISGQRAFRRDTAAETMTAILKEDPPEIVDLAHPVSPGLERIVRRCLEKQPEQRFQSAKDLAFALEALTGTTTSSKTGANVAISTPASKKSSWPIIAAIVASLAVGAAAAWFLHPHPAPPPAFTQVSFDRGTVLRARFAPDGKSIIFSARLNGGPLDTYVIRDEYPESASLGLHGAMLLSVSKQGQLAVIVRPKTFAHLQSVGTLATAPIGGGSPRELMENVMDADWSPDGKDLAVMAVDEKKIRVQYPIGKTILEVDNWLSDMRVSPDGKLVALFRHPPATTDDRGDVIVVDQSGHVRTLSTGWESLEGLSWSPSGKEVWYSGSHAGAQYCIYASTLAGATRTVFCGTITTFMFDTLPSGRSLVMAAKINVNLTLVEHGVNKTERDLTWLDNSYGPRLSSDGSEVMFTDQSEQGGSGYAVYVRKNDGSPAVRIATGGLGTDISPDGKWAIVVLPGDPAAQVHIVPIGTGEARTLHWDGLQPEWAHWFPDGQHIMLTVTKAGAGTGYYMTDASGATPKLLTQHGFDTIWPGIAPDGHSYIVGDKDGASVHSILDNSTRPIPNAHPQNDVTLLAWAGDSEHVFVQEVTPSGIEIIRFDVNTGKKEPWQILTPKDRVGLIPSGAPIGITPDGRWMAYTHMIALTQLYRSDNMQ